jgi:hypothetical protein
VDGTYCLSMHSPVHVAHVHQPAVTCCPLVPRVIHQALGSPPVHHVVARGHPCSSSPNRQCRVVLQPVVTPEVTPGLMRDPRCQSHLNGCMSYCVSFLSQRPRSLSLSLSLSRLLGCQWGGGETITIGATQTHAQLSGSTTKEAHIAKPKPHRFPPAAMFLPLSRRSCCHTVIPQQGRVAAVTLFGRRKCLCASAVLQGVLGTQQQVLLLMKLPNQQLPDTCEGHEAP